jgi:molybdopterin converting factor small subunit
MYVEFLGIPRERTGVTELQIEAATLGEALDTLATRFPRFGELVTGGRLHASLAANLNADLFVTDPATPLAPHDRLLLLSADAGG